MPPPSRSERNAIRLPSGENVGSDSSAGSLVSRHSFASRELLPPDVQIACPARSEAYATSLPSGENAGSVVRPESEVNRVNVGAGVGGAGRVSHHVRAAVAASEDQRDDRQRQHGDVACSSALEQALATKGAAPAATEIRDHVPTDSGAAGSFSRQCRTICSTCGDTPGIGSGSCFRIAVIVSTLVSPRNGRRPASIS